MKFKESTPNITKLMRIRVCGALILEKGKISINFWKSWKILSFK
jgi:hypothetical protein